MPRPQRRPSPARAGNRLATADKDRALSYVRKFYEAHTSNIQAMLDGAQNGAIAFLSGMTEKEVKPLSELLVTAAFEMALAVLPAGSRASALWEQLSKARPKFAKTAEFLAAKGQAAALGGASLKGGDKSTIGARTGVLKSALTAIHQKTYKGKRFVNTEWHAAEGAVIDRFQKGERNLEQWAKTKLGVVPLEVDVKKLQAGFEHELFKQYVKQYVVVTHMYHAPTRQRLPTMDRMSGLEKGSYQYIEKTYPEITHERDLAKWGARVERDEYYPTGGRNW